MCKKSKYEEISYTHLSVYLKDIFKRYWISFKLWIVCIIISTFYRYSRLARPEIMDWILLQKRYRQCRPFCSLWLSYTRARAHADETWTGIVCRAWLSHPFSQHWLKHRECIRLLRTGRHDSQIAKCAPRPKAHLSRRIYLYPAETYIDVTLEPCFYWISRLLDPSREDMYIWCAMYIL